MARHEKLAGVDLDKSYLLGVIYDDVSLTLEIDFHLVEGHPQYVQTESSEGCYRKGFIQFANIEDLRLKRAKADGTGSSDLSIIETATIEEDYCHMMSGWGEIELTAQSIRIAID